jgi:snapalysin
MRSPRTVGVLAGTAVAAVLVAVGMSTAVAAPDTAPDTRPAPQPKAVQIVTYDPSQAEEFVDVVDQGAQIWNETVENVELQKVEPGADADLTISADDGWPRAQVDGLGSGHIWMGREAVDMGYYPPRIAAHEIGHILGLPDRRTGLCEDLMSGSSAAIDCKNDHPNAAETAEVEANFGGGATRTVTPHVYVDRPAA